MPQNLFAACRVNSSLVVRRIQLDNSVQTAIESIFNDQSTSFTQGITTEVDFNGSWTPENDELLTINTPSEADVFEETINANATSIPDLNTGTFISEGIKALFTGSSSGERTRVLVQRFTSHQILEHKFALLQQGNAFRKLTEPAFTLDNSLTCIIEGGKIKFKSQQKLRSIINMLDIYREATDQEVQSFAGHNILEVQDIASFLSTADQTSRKLISAITRSDTLNTYTVPQIEAAASQVGVTIEISNGKIVMPSTRADIKNLLRFLDDGLYEAPLSRQRYITNSKKPFPA